MGSASVRVRAALLYLFILSLAYLAGVYVGRIYYFAYLALLLVPFLSTVQLLIALAGLRYHQEFDTEHPVKGESIGYRLTIANESFIATGPIDVAFKSIHRDLAGIKAATFRFTGSGSDERTYTIQCPYRGIYTVGLESLRLRDSLGWLAVRRPVYHRTFYVYPRIVDLAPAFAGSARLGLTTRSESGTERDTSLFEGLAAYRAGTPLRHIAWKKFVATGSPYLKDYGRSAQPGITLYLDLRREGPPSRRVLESEDCSIEITVALVKYFLEAHVPLRVKAMGMDLYTFEASDPDSFERFYRHTINLLFQRSVSPVDIYLADRNAAAAGASLFVTHRLDSELFDLAARSRPGSIGLIVNEHSMSDEERDRLDGAYKTMRENGADIFVVRGPNTIREDLSA